MLHPVACLRPTRHSSLVSCPSKVRMLCTKEDGSALFHRRWSTTKPVRTWPRSGGREVPLSVLVNRNRPCPAFFPTPGVI